MAQASIHQIAVAVLKLSKTHSNDKLIETVAAYVVTERRSADLSAIMREVARLRKLQGATEATITTAVPATSAVKAEVKRLIGDENAVINEIVDKNVIGGVRIETNDYYLDLTVRNRLNKLKVGVNN